MSNNPDNRRPFPCVLPAEFGAFLADMPTDAFASMVDCLVDVFANPVDINERQWVCESLGFVSPDEERADLLMERVEEVRHKLRRYFLKALMRNPSDKVTEFLIESLRSNDEVVRWLSAYALRKRVLSAEHLEQLDGYIRKGIHKKKPYGTFLLLTLLSNEAFRGSEYREHYFEHSEEHPLVTQSLLIAAFVRWFSADKVRPLLERLADHAEAGMRESVVDAFIALECGEEFLRGFCDDADEQIALKAKKHLGEEMKCELPNVDEDKVRGVIYAAALGDAIGAPVEFLSRDQIFDIYGGEVEGYADLEARGQLFRTKVGDITDDAAMGLGILEGFVDSGYFDVSAIGKIWARDIEEIDNGDAANKGYGHSSSMDMRRLLFGCNWRYSGHDGKGCGSGMRAFVLPLLAKDEDELRRISFLSSKPTHYSDIGRAGAFVIASAIRRLMIEEGEFDRDAFLRECVASVRDICPKMAERIEGLSAYLDREDTSQALLEMGTDGAALETIPAAIYCFLRSPRDFAETLKKSSNTDGDSDSIASIACALSGAYNGISALPKELIEGLNQKEEIEGLIQRFLDMRAGVDGVN